MIGAICIFGVLGAIAFLMLIGLFIIEPGQAVVHLSWGNYIQTIKEPGIHYIFPFGRSLRPISSRERTYDIPSSTVVEATGNPVIISAVVRYKVLEPEKAILAVDNYKQFVADQASAIIKRVISQYPYESPDPEIPCLRKETDEIGVALRHELQEVAKVAGVKILSVKLNDLTYAPEIAQSMLIRQQALALIDARKTIVEGAVDMVKDAADQLEDLGFQLPMTERNRLVANLMVVLCSNQDTQPVISLQAASGR
jgi:regulator of protease activity HflC (stomatin/prohibitin superfamily)